MLRVSVGCSQVLTWAAVSPGDSGGCFVSKVIEVAERICFLMVVRGGGGGVALAYCLLCAGSHPQVWRPVVTCTMDICFFKAVRRLSLTLLG